jgi:4-amino-4-deoxy-L-arabinose transferase-like glycosyltransferase
MHQDEAAPAWNAWCLLKTGKDQTGVSWPVFYYRALGEYRSSLFMYYLLPFEAIGGMSIWTIRFASALGGVAAVALVYFVGKRLLGRGGGLLAAGLMSVDTWAVQHSRWAHDAAIVPLLVVLPVAVLLWANLPFDGDGSRRPRPLLAGLGGAMAGLSCYGYPCVPQFLPLFLLLGIAVTWRGWWELLKTRRGAGAIGAMVLAGAATFGPLLYTHLTDPNIGKRGKQLRVFKDTDPTGVKIKKMLGRYPAHFGLDFLFIDGEGGVRRDTDPDPECVKMRGKKELPHYCPPGYGQLHWYMLPLMLLGAAAAILRSRSSWGARIVLVWVLLYPAGDLVSGSGVTPNDWPHCLRSFPGLPGLVLLGAMGAAWAGELLRRRVRGAFWPTAAALVVAVLFLNVRFYGNYFGKWSREEVYGWFQTDVVKASQWLRPRLAEADAVFFTPTYTNRPYVIAAVELRIDPADWHKGPIEKNIWLKDPNEDVRWDTYFRFGKVFFLYDLYWDARVRELLANGREDRVYFVVRPADLQRWTQLKVQFATDPKLAEQYPEYQPFVQLLEGLLPQLGKPVHTIVGPRGNEELLIFELRV